MGELNKILHVEDEADIREIAHMALELIGGFEVQQAALGTIALEIVQGFAPDMILIDVQMPELTGPETLVEIRKMPRVLFIPSKMVPYHIKSIRKKMKHCLTNNPT